METQVLSKAEQTKQKILLAAIDLFAAKGFHAVSMREIGEQVGIWKGSIYHHFESKEAILGEIFSIFPSSEDNSENFPSKEAYSQIKTLDDLKILLKQMFTSWRKQEENKIYQKVVHIVIIEQLHSEKLKEYLYNYIADIPRKYYSAIFKCMQEKGILKQVDLEEMTEMLIVKYKATFLDQAVFSKNPDFDAIEKDYFNFYDYFCDLHKA